MNTNINPEDMRRRANKGLFTSSQRRLILIAVVLVVVIIAFAALKPFVTVPTGHTGIVTTFGHVEDYTLDEGFHFKNPIQQVILMDNRVQKAHLTLQAFSSDIQQVDVECSVNYSITKSTAQVLYKSVGKNYYETVMQPRILENVKAVFTRYNAEKLMEVRNALSGQVMDLLSPEMEAYGIEVKSIAIENVDFTDAFTNAVEDKQVAEQTKLKVETEQAQQVSVEKSTAERRIIAANADAQERTILATADAEVAKVQADAAAYAREVEATAEAKANQLIAASLTSDLIEYEKATNWDGQLPKITGTDSVIPMLDMEIDGSASGSDAAK